jgi:phosphoenolpyruvate phosphomutase
MVQPLSLPPFAAFADEETKTARLRRLLAGPGLSFLMEAHNGLSAKIAEEAGFAGIWGSGLSISASLGVRDNNEASWTQVLEVVEFMADATRVPILLDGDTGYGNFNSARRLVQKLEQRGVAGVCLEDKLFPKTNSFLRSTSQPLADKDEFAGKIRAAKEAQRDDAFVVVARVEALIAGHGLGEALARAEAYRRAGADAILIHSSKKNASEVLAFQREWGERLPVVIVPTKYYTTPTDVFREAGFRVVIWANHLMRAALASMQETAKRIFDEQSLVTVEERVAPIAEVFRLQGEAELERAERAYLPRASPAARGIVLAAGATGCEELGALALDRPKCMIPIAGKPILAHILDAFRSAGVRDLVVVRGYAKGAVDLAGPAYVDNDAFATTGELGSLAAAAGHLEGPCVVAYGDVLVKRYVLEELLDAEADFAIAVDSLPVSAERRALQLDCVVASEPHARAAILHDVTLTDVTSDPRAPGVTGEWTGLLKLSAEGARAVREMLAEAPELAASGVPELLRRLVARGRAVRVVYARGGWLDVDTLADVVRGSVFS